MSVEEENYAATTGRRRLLLALAAVGGIALFALMAIPAASGETRAFDRDILLALRQSDNVAATAGPHWLGVLMPAITELAGTPLLTVLTIVLAGYFITKRASGSLAILLAVVIGQSIVVQLLKGAFGRERPDFLPHLVEATSPSFPSGHSASAAAVFLTLAAFIAHETRSASVRVYVFLVAIILALAVAFSRVFVGVHYPTDVIGGLGVGAAWAAFIWLVASYSYRGCRAQARK